ncbi:MAG: tRNA (adenosine(37)-N6)-threonylcarbamoyltransferase complex dimerization subunit type 1 TsaB [Candidatus Omnitrophota bacterium]
MYILSLETSTKIFSLAVSKDDKILRFRNIRTDRILESSIIPAIDKLLVSCHLSLKDIDTLAIGLGPGSFTSLRVGLSTVKAFALATNKKLIGVSSLDILASGVVSQRSDEICVLVDARRGKVYAAIFDKSLNCKSGYLLTTLDDVLGKVHGETLFVGDGLVLYKEHIEKSYQEATDQKQKGSRPMFSKERFWYPKAIELARLLSRNLINLKYEDPAKIVPIYLYPQDCQVNRK